MPLVHDDSFVLSLLIWVTFVSCLIAVVRTSSPLLNTNGESRHPFLVPDFCRKACCSSPLSIMSAMFFIIGFYFVQIYSLWLHFVRLFILNGCWILSSAFPAPVEMIMWLLYFGWCVCITVIDLHMLNHACEPGANPTWLCCVFLFSFTED